MTVLREGKAVEAGFIENRIDLINERAAGWIDPRQTRSLVLLLARKGVVVLHGAWGPLTADADSPPIQCSSVFPMASLAKPVTATAVMLLVEDGLLGLSRPLVEYIPEISGRHTEDILVHHLLTHTSGLQDLDDASMQERLNGLTDLPPCPEDQHEIIHRVLHAAFELDCAKRPGEEMAYTNRNYGLLAEIVRRISGQSFWDFARERIFKPLGMVDSSFRFEERYEGRFVRATLDPMPFVDVPSGQGGLKSTAWDLAIFGQTFLNGGIYGTTRLLSRASVREMTRNQIPGIGSDFNGWHPEASWGLGWRIQDNERWRYFDGALQPAGTIDHAGFGGRLLRVDPKNDIVAVYLAVCLDINIETKEHHTQWDLFQNLVYAAME